MQNSILLNIDQTKRCLKCLLLLASCFADIQSSQAQKKVLSITDSLKVTRYWKEANKVPLYSQQRQQFLDSILAIEPGNAYFWQQKAMPLYKQKKYEAGSRFLDSAVKYDRKAYTDYRAFMKCIFQKSYREAIRGFHDAKSLRGNGGVMDHTYDFYLGLSHLQLNQFDSSEYYLTKTTNDQRNARGENWIHYLDLFYLGIVHYERGEYAKAIATFDRSIKLYHNFSDAKYYKAICLRRLKRTEESEVVFKEAKEDFIGGATINEDNNIYESYPYQIDRLGYYK